MVRLPPTVPPVVWEVGLAFRFVLTAVAVEANAMNWPSFELAGSVSSAGPSVSWPGKEALLGSEPPVFVYRKYKWLRPALAPVTLRAENTSSPAVVPRKVGRCTWSKPVSASLCASVGTVC